MPDAEGVAGPEFKTESGDVVGEGNYFAGIGASLSEGSVSAAAATVLPPMIDFTAFQFAAPSSTTRIGALSVPEPQPPTA